MMWCIIVCISYNYKQKHEVSPLHKDNKFLIALLLVSQSKIRQICYYGQCKVTSNIVSLWSAFDLEVTVWRHRSRKLDLFIITGHDKRQRCWLLPYTFYVTRAFIAGTKNAIYSHVIYMEWLCIMLSTNDIMPSKNNTALHATRQAKSQIDTWYGITHTCQRPAEVSTWMSNYILNTALNVVTFLTGYRVNTKWRQI